MSEHEDPATPLGLKERAVARRAWPRVTNFAQNGEGDWVPAIPLPFIGLRKKCTCGAKFWTTEGYRAHYALRHIVDPLGTAP